MKKKSIALLMAAALCLGGAIGGTVAWLIDSTDVVTNTFTTSDVDIELAESTNLDLKMVPGKTITKDPKVTVKAVSEACYVFVEINKSSNYSTYLEDYTIETGWKKIDGIDGVVYYREVSDTDTDQEFVVLEGNKVTVKASVTKDQMEKATPAPTLSFTAYAIQSENLGTTDIATIWKMAKPTTTAE